MPVNSFNAGQARSTRDPSKTTVSTITATTGGVFTLPAGFLDSLQAGDVVQLSALTGGSAFTAGVDYHVVCGELPFGATNCQLSETFQGQPVTGGTAITAGSISKASTAVGPRSARGR